MKPLSDYILGLKPPIILACIILVSMRHAVLGQAVTVNVVDMETKRPIPFVQLNNLRTQQNSLSGASGKFRLSASDSILISHPFYETSLMTKIHHDSMVVIELTPHGAITPTQEQLGKGSAILSKYFEYLPQTSSTQQPAFEFLSDIRIEVLSQPKNDPNNWALTNSLESLEKNRFKYPDKRYARVVKTHYQNGDSSAVGLMPFNTFTLLGSNEYISIIGLKFYNPLHNGATKRYQYALIDTVTTEDEDILVVYFGPRAKQRFVGFSGLLYFTGERFENWGGYLMPNRKIERDFSLSYHNVLTDKNTRFLKEFNGTVMLRDVPRIGQLSKLNVVIRNTLPDFNVNDTSASRWMNMALFDHKKDTLADDTWLMKQIVDKEKLDYIRKDTADRKFVLSKSIEWMYNIYDGKVGYRMRFFDLNNVFAINRFEAVRLGIGLQSHENLSDAFTFGGFVGYGFKDDEFKYGGNFGLYIGPQRGNLLSVKIKRDLQEPGQVTYMDERQDLVKDFFTSRMDNYYSLEFSLRSRISSFLSSSLKFNNFSLKPLYDYYYNPFGSELAETQKFDFTETSVLLDIGTPFSKNKYLREVLYKNRAIKGNLYLNLTKGWKTEQLEGEYDYWKLNGRFSSRVQLNRMSNLNIVVDGGIMTRDMPYPIMYGGPGTEFKLTGIIINNAFQTMQLYGFFTDRYVHSFVDYNLGNIVFRNSKFKPELALALNVGWGKINGQKEIHELIEVRDYPKGYYEAGVLLNNLLRLKIYKYFYGGLGIGTFVGFGPDAENGSLAIRISYELGVL